MSAPIAVLDGMRSSPIHLVGSYPENSFSQLLKCWVELFMHEMSLAENVLQIIEEAAQHQSFTRVKTVWLEIGQLTCVEPEALRFCFDVVMHGSIAQHAKLEIIDILGLGWCKTCMQEVPMATLYGVCSQCGNFELEVLCGDTLRVKELEVE
jgi:hydrogenase nickel incorporation protein HypA/HybF